MKAPFCVYYVLLNELCVNIITPFKRVLQNVFLIFNYVLDKDVFAKAVCYQ